MVAHQIVIEIPDWLEACSTLAVIGSFLLKPVGRAVGDGVSELIKPWVKRRCRRTARRISRALRH